MFPVYLDHNSTAPLDAQVFRAMEPYLLKGAGNPSSRHSFGRRCRQALEEARARIASAVGAQASQVVLTASGTESNNFAVQGIVKANQLGTIAVSAIEHPCVRNAANALMAEGLTVMTIPVNRDGQVSMEGVARCLEAGAELLSVMLVNNETGVIQPIAEIAELCRKKKVFLHTDAVQAFGKVPVDFAALGVHAMTVSSHKIAGPFGAAALVVDKRVDIKPLLYGGGQEKGLRSGTENIAAIVGFGEAASRTETRVQTCTQQTAYLRMQLEQGLQKKGAVIFGQDAPRVANTSFFAFPDIDGETLVMALDKQGLAVASGSACSSDSSEPSPVLLAMGVDPDLARGALRVSLGPENTLADIDRLLQALEIESRRFQDMAAIAASA